ncbi:unnamed protein product [Durusdinium trenchii]|uniref:Uncharacterized protein n=1 Tax=Durusdinium trenchii TaxID=1381693 RepID=A0ABP0J513_9DINO
MKFTEHNSILTLSADVGEVRVHDFQQRSMHGNATAASLSRRVKEDLLKRAFVVLKARAAKNCTKAPEARGGFEARNKAELLLWQRSFQSVPKKPGSGRRRNELNLSVQCGADGVDSQGVQEERRGRREIFHRPLSLVWS